MFLLRGGPVQGVLFAAVVVLLLARAQCEQIDIDEDAFYFGPNVDASCDSVAYIANDAYDAFTNDAYDAFSSRSCYAHRDKVDLFICPNSIVEDNDAWINDFLSKWQELVTSNCVLTYPLKITYDPSFGSDRSGERKCYQVLLYSETLTDCNGFPRCAGGTTLCCDFGLCSRRRTQEAPAFDDRDLQGLSRRYCIGDIVDDAGDFYTAVDFDGECDCSCGQDGSMVLEQLERDFGEIGLAANMPTPKPTDAPTAKPTAVPNKACNAGEKTECAVHAALSFGGKSG